MRDRCALITGASAGIGAAFAERLAADGWDLILVARRKDRLDALADRLGREAGAAAEVLAADLGDDDGLQRVCERAADEARLGLVVNNAGFGGYRPFAELDPRVADELIDVHVRAVVRITRAALPGMITRGTGGIINIASLLAFSGTLPPDPLPYRATYAGAKSFMVTFTQALAGELGGMGVKASVCCPGRVATEFHDVVGVDVSHVPRMSASDVVQAALAGLERGEVVSVPGMEDPAALAQLAEIQRSLLAHARSTDLATRYRSPG